MESDGFDIFLCLLLVCPTVYFCYKITRGRSVEEEKKTTKSSPVPNSETITSSGKSRSKHSSSSFDHSLDPVGRGKSRKRVSSSSMTSRSSSSPNHYYSYQPTPRSSPLRKMSKLSPRGTPSTMRSTPSRHHHSPSVYYRSPSHPPSSGRRRLALYREREMVERMNSADRRRGTERNYDYYDEPRKSPSQSSRRLRYLEEDEWYDHQLEMVRRSGRGRVNRERREEVEKEIGSSSVESEEDISPEEAHKEREKSKKRKAPKSKRNVDDPNEVTLVDNSIQFDEIYTSNKDFGNDQEEKEEYFEDNPVFSKRFLPFPGNVLPEHRFIHLDAGEEEQEKDNQYHCLTEMTNNLFENESDNSNSNEDTDC
jgi:hypothetical protein